jgi:hypothetical protein
VARSADQADLSSASTASASATLQSRRKSHPTLAPDAAFGKAGETVVAEADKFASRATPSGRSASSGTRLVMSQPRRLLARNVPFLDMRQRKRPIWARMRNHRWLGGFVATKTHEHHEDASDPRVVRLGGAARVGDLPEQRLR